MDPERVPARRLTGAGLLASIGLLLAATLASVGCGDNDSSSQERLCDDVDQLESALKSVQDIRPGSVAEDLRQVRSDIDEAVSDIRQSGSDVPEVQDVEDAVDELEAAVNALPDNVSVDQAIREVGPAVISLTSALLNLRGALNCE